MHIIIFGLEHISAINEVHNAYDVQW